MALGRDAATFAVAPATAPKQPPLTAREYDRQAMASHALCRSTCPTKRNLAEYICPLEI